MNLSPKICFLYHSRLLFIPLVGTILYKVQNYLYSKGFINFAYISKKQNPEQRNLLNKISAKSTYVLCRSYKLGITLGQLKLPIIADFSAPINLKNLPLNKLHNVSWTLILASGVTSMTKNSLGDFLPKNFPVVDIRNLF